MYESRDTDTKEKLIAKRETAWEPAGEASVEEDALEGAREDVHAELEATARLFRENDARGGEGEEPVVIACFTAVGSAHGAGDGHAAGDEGGEEGGGLGDGEEGREDPRDAEA